jgi:pteridine reductase|tara:strand:+ start:365 stop:1159 length:795 start_codon:yes stop_codon:yes gene_type:complete
MDNFESIDEGQTIRMFMAQRVALITGGGKRIGAATASLLLDSDWFVFIHVRTSVSEAEEILQAYEQKTGSKASAEILQADLNSDEELAELITTVLNHEKVKSCGGLHALIHNASIYSSKDYESVNLEELRLNNRLHIEVPFLLTQAFLNPLKLGRGCVIGMIDTSLGRAWKGLSHYTASKAGLRQLMMNLAGDLAPEVRVNCVAPGAIIAADWESEHFASIVDKIPLGRAGEPSDVAKAILFLVESTYISGQILNVDGGWSVSP